MTQAIGPIRKFINWLFSRWAWWQRWFGPGTYDDWRNPFWRYTEAHKIKPVRACYVFDLRLGFKRGGKWKSYWNSGLTWRLAWDWAKAPVMQNFWNGIFTTNFYLTEDDHGKLHPRFGIVFRPLHDWWFEAGAGRLFDRGEMALKCTIMNWKGEGSGDAEGWNEGSV